jgi:hypothetical protein
MTQIMNSFWKAHSISVVASLTDWLTETCLVNAERKCLVGWETACDVQEICRSCCLLDCFKNMIQPCSMHEAETSRYFSPTIMVMKWPQSADHGHIVMQLGQYHHEAEQSKGRRLRIVYLTQLLLTY